MLEYMVYFIMRQGEEAHLEAGIGDNTAGRLVAAAAVLGHHGPVPHHGALGVAAACRRILHRRELMKHLDDFESKIFDNFYTISNHAS